MSNNATCISLEHSNSCTGFGDYYVQANDQYSNILDFDNYIRAQSNPLQVADGTGCNSDQLRDSGDSVRYMNGLFCTQQIQQSWSSCNAKASTSSVKNASLTTRKQQRTRLMRRQNFNDISTPMMCLSDCIAARDSVFNNLFMNSTVCPLSASSNELLTRQVTTLNLQTVCTGLVDNEICLHGTNFESGMCGFPSLGTAQNYCNAAGDQKPSCCSRLGTTPTATPTPESSNSDNGGLAVGWRVLIALLALLLLILILVGLLLWSRKRKQKKEAALAAKNVSRSASQNSQRTANYSHTNSPNGSLKGAFVAAGVSKSPKGPNYDSQAPSNSGDSVTTLSMLDSENGQASNRQSLSAENVPAGKAKSGRFSSVVNPFVAALGGFFAGRKSSSQQQPSTGAAGNLDNEEMTSYNAHPPQMQVYGDSAQPVYPDNNVTASMITSSYAAVVSTTTTTETRNNSVPANSDIVEAIHVYLPTLNDELHLEIGDKILVLKRFDDGWASGSKLSTGEEGAFPLICTRPWDVNASNITPANTNPTKSSTSATSSVSQEQSEHDSPKNGSPKNGSPKNESQAVSSDSSSPKSSKKGHSPMQNIDSPDLK